MNVLMIGCSCVWLVSIIQRFVSGYVKDFVASEFFNFAAFHTLGYMHMNIVFDVRALRCVYYLIACNF